MNNVKPAGIVKKILILCVFSIVISGCASNVPKEVKIPVAVKQPSPKIPPKPVLPIATLKTNSKPNDVIKAYAASVQILQGYSDQLITILKSYKG